MNRVLLVFFVVFAFAARSDGTLKCYMCESLSNPACGDPSKDGNSPPVECDLMSMKKWHTEILQHRDFQHIASLFEVDDPQHSTHISDVACAKMNLKIGSKNVTLRSCQSAKTPTVDTCGAIKDKLSKFYGNNDAWGYCGLCYTDACNGSIDVAPPKIVQLLIGVIGLMLLQALRHRFA